MADLGVCHFHIFQETLPTGDNGKEDIQVKISPQSRFKVSFHAFHIFSRTLEPTIPRQRYIGYLLGKGGAAIADIEKVLRYIAPALSGSRSSQLAGKWLPDLCQPGDQKSWIQRCVGLGNLTAAVVVDADDTFLPVMQARSSCLVCRSRLQMQSDSSIFGWSKFKSDQSCGPASASLLDACMQFSQPMLQGIRAWNSTTCGRNHQFDDFY